MKTYRFTDVSVYSDFRCNRGSVPLQRFLEEIREGADRESIDLLRSYLTEGLPKEAEAVKKGLKAVTVSATYKGARQMKNMEQYNGIIVLDFDHLTGEDTERVKKRAIECPYTLACFISPSGNGVKVIVVPAVSFPAILENHRKLFKVVAGYYEFWTGAKVDRSGSDAGRLCFTSFDPDLYYNPEVMDAEQEKMDEKMAEFSASASRSGSGKASDGSKIMEKAWKHVQKNLGEYEEGNRNNFVFTLALRCLMKELPAETLILLLENRCRDLSSEEIYATVRSAESYLDNSALREENGENGTVKKNERFFSQSD